MYDQELQPVAMTPRRRGRGWLWVLSALVVVIGLLIWVAGRRTRYQRVAVFPLTQDEQSEDLLLGCGITPCLAGFCVREDAFVFALRDWEKGEQLWQVSTNVPYTDKDTSPVQWEAEGEYDADVSPDGHCFVAASSQEAVLRVQSWRDGKALGDAAIDLVKLPPSPPKPGQPARMLRLMATITDGRRCFVVFALAPYGELRAVHTIVVEGDRILAYDVSTRGVLFSPDGNALYREPVMAGVGIEGRELRLRQRLMLPEGELRLGADGTAILEDGAIYRLSGKHTRMPGFTNDTVTISGRYALFTKGKVSRVVEVKTGRYWEVTVPRENLGGDVTEDGEHYLALFANAPGGVSGALQRRMNPDAREHFIALYERPGRLRAWMQLDRLRPSSWWPSPDGRAVVFTTDDQCLLYRLSRGRRLLPPARPPGAG